MFGQIQPLTSADLPGCLALARDRGWLPEEGKWRLLFDLAVVYGVRDSAGELAGVAVLTRYGAEFAVIGMMLVATRYGGRGLGRALMNRALAEVGDAIVFLHATPVGRPLYEKLGFVPAGASHTYLGGFRPRATAAPAGSVPAGSALAGSVLAGSVLAGSVLAGSVSAGSVSAGPATAGRAPAAATAAEGGSRPAGPGDLMAIRRLDARANGTDRALLVRRLPGFTEQLRVTERPGGITGYAGAYRGVAYTCIGPVIAETADDAKTLIADVASGIAGPVRIDLGDRHPQLREWVVGRGLTPGASAALMVLGGRPLPGDRARCFAPLMRALG
jgi:GNAT superfamily N-acetyltransferase